MSKSKGNVVSPDEMIARYGADAARMYSLFAAPPDRDLDWQEDGVAGISRFLARVYRLVSTNAAELLKCDSIEPTSSVSVGEKNEAERKLLRATHRAIGKITEDFAGRWHFNTSIAELMIFVNLLNNPYQLLFENGYKGINPKTGSVSPKITREVLQSLVLLLAPFAPHLASELWEKLGQTRTSLLRHPWPKFDEALAREDQIEVPVQINGKLRGLITVPAEASREMLEAAARADEKVQAALAGKTVVKVVVVPGKLINFVVR
jgi:leucyl-tRNA synthetase